MKGIDGCFQYMWMRDVQLKRAMLHGFYESRFSTTTMMNLKRY